MTFCNNNDKSWFLIFVVDFQQLWPQLFRKITKFKTTIFSILYSFIAEFGIILMLIFLIYLVEMVISIEHTICRVLTNQDS